MKKIASGDISVVIQGPKSEHLIPSLNAINKFLPNAEIILSVWRSDISTIKDILPRGIKLVINKNIPPLYYDPISGVEDNLIRQVTTTLSGLKKAKRPYSLKIRSDTILTGKSFFVINEAIEHPLLSSKITATNFGFVNPSKLPFLGYFPDMVMFGETKDLIHYWDFRERPRYYFSMKELFLWKINFANSGFRLCKYGCEQQLALAFSRKIFPEVDLKHIDDFSDDMCYLFERVAYTSFHVIEHKKSDLDFGEKFNNSKYTKTFYACDEFNALESQVETPIHYTKRLSQIKRRKYLLSLFSPLFYKSILAIMVYIYVRLGDRFYMRRRK